MKKNVKGFMLIETLIVSTLVTTILVFLYVQFNNIVKTFNTELHYNNVSNLYTATKIKNYILKYADDDGVLIDNLVSALKNNIIAANSKYYVYFYNVDDDNVNNSVDVPSFLKVILEQYEIKNIIFKAKKINMTSSDLNSFKENPKLVNYIKYSQKSNTSNEENIDYLSDFTLIIEFADNNFASVNFSL